MTENKDAKHLLLDYCKSISENSSAPFDRFLLSLQPVIKEECRTDYRLIEEENAAGRGAHHLSDYLAPDANPEEQYMTYQIFLLRQENIRKSSGSLFKKEDLVLELGSGPLDKEGDSHLSSAFPKEIAAHFSFCDINPNIIEKSLDTSPGAPIKVSDVTRLLRDYEKASFDKIVALNTLDTLTLEDLTRALKGIHALLKPHGMLIHYMNLEPFIYALVYNLADEDHLLIPILDRDHDRKFLLVKKSLYHDTIRERLVVQKIDAIKITFLDYAFSLSRLQQERLAIAAIFSNEGKEFAFLGRLLSQWGTLFSPMDFYEERMKEALASQGFTLEKSYFEKSEKTIAARIGGPYEQARITYGPKGKEIALDEEIEWGKSRLNMMTHILIAIRDGVA